LRLRHDEGIATSSVVIPSDRMIAGQFVALSTLEPVRIFLESVESVVIPSVRARDSRGGWDMPIRLIQDVAG
jgi:hypothetical protein